MSWKGPIRKIDEYRHEIPVDYRSGAMKQAGLSMLVPGLIYADEGMIKTIIRDHAPEHHHDLRSP